MVSQLPYPTSRLASSLCQWKESSGRSDLDESRWSRPKGHIFTASTSHQDGLPNHTDANAIISILEVVLLCLTVLKRSSVLNAIKKVLLRSFELVSVFSSKPLSADLKVKCQRRYTLAASRSKFRPPFPCTCAIFVRTLTPFLTERLVCT